MAHPAAGVNSADIALTRAEWQPVLFGTPDRAQLAACIPEWPLQPLRVRVHRNHGFEAVSSATPAYAAWNGLDLAWSIGGYDDSLTFDAGSAADVDVVWLDTGRIRGFAGGDGTAWLAGRLRALRARTTNPIVVLAWPLADRKREELDDGAIAGVYCADLAPLADALGARWLDPRAESLSGTRLGNAACLRIARELACRWLPGSAMPARKAIAVDLDGTLYRGVLGEEGASGVALTGAHRELHAQLARYRDAGMLLALISRNERADVEQLFDERTDFPLRLADFSAIEISWDDKPGALRRIAERLRIGADAIVFVDDNAGELASVATSLPAFTVHAGDDPAQTAAALDHVAGLFRWRRSAEDRVRAKDLRASQQRETLLDAAASDDDYLQSLQVRLDFLVGPRCELARLAELSTKTNQFNLSLRRMNEAQIAQRLDDRASNVVAIRLADRLSDSGIVGVLVGSRSDSALRVDELCVSCRALGRRLEDAMLTKALLVMAGDPAPDKVVFALSKGPRNEPARRWLASYAGTALDEEAAALEMSFGAIAARTLPAAIRIEVLQ